MESKGQEIFEKALELYKVREYARCVNLLKGKESFLKDQEEMYRKYASDHIKQNIYRLGEEIKTLNRRIATIYTIAAIPCGNDEEMPKEIIEVSTL